MTEQEVEPGPGTRAADACLAPVVDAWRDAEQEIGSEVIQPLRALVTRHREVLSELGLDDAPPDDWSTRSDRLLEYRKVMGDELLEPLIAALDEGGPSLVIRRHAEQAVASAAERCRALPAQLRAPWPEGALRTLDTDRAPRRIAKLLARGVGAARKAGRERMLPIRAVALRHLDEEVAAAQDELAVQAMVRWAEWSGALEADWIAWGDEALAALVRAERLEGSESAEEPWRTLAAAASALQTALEARLDDAPDLIPVVEARLGASRGVLEGDLAVAGSFVYRPEAPARPRPLLPRTTRSAPALAAWHDAVAARLSMYVALLAILAGATAVQRRLIWRFRERCLVRVRELPKIARTLDALAQEVARAGADESLADRLSGIEPSVQAALAPAVEAIPEPALVDSIVRDGSDATVEALLSMVRQAPATVALHADDARVPTGGRRVETRAVAFQELARQSFDALRIERIRSSTLGLIGAIDHAREKVAALPEVFTYASEAARTELEQAGEGAEERGRQLVKDALHNLAESLRHEGTKLDGAVADAQSRLAGEIGDGSSALLDRLAAGGVQAQLLAARSWAADLRGLVLERWGPPAAAALSALTTRVAALRRLVLRSVRKGTAIVSGGEAAASSRTIKALADAQALIDRLPLVYQRLFTLNPVAEPVLLAGRELELADAMARFQRWRSEDGIPLVVRGRQGAGTTSFVNVLGARIAEEGGSVRTVSLDERVGDETGLARLLAEPLGIEGVATLEELADAIFATPEGSLPDALVVDNLEHLYMRVPRGTDVVERLLTLMAETEPRVFWISCVTRSAWQLIATAEPTAINQVDVLDLGPLSSQAVRRAVEARHRRSGLPVRFHEPASGRRLLRRRLRRLRDPTSHNNLLEDDYFERLHRASSGDIRLALFQWLLSADFDSGDGVLMRMPERPDFSVLESLDLTQNFTLKALIEHRTLTLEEHDRIFRVPRQQSYQIFESLQNRHLIESVGASNGDAPRRSEVQEDLRYRVRPLLVGAVIGHLQARNIVH